MRDDLIENGKVTLWFAGYFLQPAFFPMLGFLWSAERWTEEGYPEVYSFETILRQYVGDNWYGGCGNDILCFSNHETMDNREKRIFI